MFRLFEDSSEEKQKQQNYFPWKSKDNLFS